ncbi:MAG: sulfate permease [Gammaproteobacteria bacterium]|nr:sulfate permease [Gammaproteobacteria bacterium]
MTENKLRFETRFKNWRSYIPILDVIRHYRREDFPHDLVAGLVVGVITVPQAVAYAFLAGLPAQAGLYACLAPMVIYAVLGSSKQLVVGPVAIAALMVAATVSEFAPQYSNEYLGITTVLCLQAGLVLLLLRVSNMGGLVNLLSHPVINGFVMGAAILIVISQLSAFTGIDRGAANDPFNRLAYLLAHADTVNPASFVIGIACLAGLWLVRLSAVPMARLFFKNIVDGHPIARTGPMMVATAAAFAVWAGDWEASYGLATVGHVPSGLPEFTLPPFDLDLWIDLVPSSAMIALVAYVESFSIGTTIATKQRTRINANQELIALGAANIGAAFTGAYPVAGSFSRSSVNYQSGGRTPVSSLVCMVVIILTLLFFTPLIRHLPNAALAAIVMVSVVGLMDIKSFREHWKVYRLDTVTQGATLVTVLLFGVETGLLTGVGLSIAFFVRRSSRPKIAIVGRISNTEHFRTAKRYDVETFPHVAAVRVDENLYFANSNQVENKLLKIVQRRSNTKHLLLVCSAINMIDVTGLEMLYRINANFERMGIKLHLSEVKGPVMEQLQDTDFIVTLSGSVFFTTDQAMKDLSERV